MPIHTASIVPLYADAAKKDILFQDRIVKSRAQSADYLIHLHAPRAGAAETYQPAARRLLAESFNDTGDIKGDLLRAFIKQMVDYIPEYARVASAHSHTGPYVHMPSVTFSLTDGQLIAVGRPGSTHGIDGVPANKNTALLWDKPTHVNQSGPRRLADAAPRRTRHVDAEFQSQTDPGFDSDRFKPVVEVLATLLAATEAVRSKITAQTDEASRPLLPNGPLRVKPLVL